jgi:hypothetical protein
MESLFEENLFFSGAHTPKVRVVGVEVRVHNPEFQRPQHAASLVLDFFGEAAASSTCGVVASGC